MDISMDIHKKSVDMDMDMGGKFRIHGKPGHYFPRAYGYLPSPTASPPFDRYKIILLGDRGTCVTT